MTNKVINFYIVVLLISLIMSCQPKKILNECDKKDYVEMQTLYPNMLVNHFPSIDKAGSILYLGLTPPKGKWKSRIQLIMSYNNEEIEKIQSNTERSALRKYTFMDSCLMVVDYDSSLYETTPIKLKQCSNFGNLLPISNFKFCIDAGATFEFYKKATIYVLGAEKGKFLEDGFLTKDGVGLPEEWKHGYTKGILISENLVAYWLEVW